MDIKSIIDSEDTPPPRKSSVPTPVRPDYRPSQTRPSTVYEAQVPAYDNRCDVRPPQPSPLQTPAHNGFQIPNGSLHNNVPSPYQHTASSASSSGAFPSPQILTQSPGRGHPPSQHATREGYSTSGGLRNQSLGHSTPLNQTPTSSTPGSASGFSNFPRPTSSHSIKTPSSAQETPNFFRESPQPLLDQRPSLSHSQSGHQYMSQPGTPLGPPSTHGQSSFNPLRESPGTYEPQRNLSGFQYSQHATTPSPARADSPPSHKRQHSQSSINGYPGASDREKSLSVSPKTMLPGLPNLDRRDPLNSPSDHAAPWNGQVTPAKRKPVPEPSNSGLPESPMLDRTPSRLINVHGLLNAEPSNERRKRGARQQQTQSPMKVDPVNAATEFQTTPAPSVSEPYPNLNRQTPRTPSMQKVPSHHDPVQKGSPIAPAEGHHHSDSLSPLLSGGAPFNQITTEPAVSSSASLDVPLQPIKPVTGGCVNSNMKVQRSIKVEEFEPFEDNSNGSSEPAKKKPRLGESMNSTVLPSVEKNVGISKISTIPRPARKKPSRVSNWQDVPVYAQSVRGPKRTAELFAMLQHGQGMGSRLPPPKQGPNGAISAQYPSQTNGHVNVNGLSPASNGVHIPIAQPPLADDGPLGPWEPSILNIIPSEELTKIISDWLFQHVVMRDDVGVGPAGGAASQGAVLEIEAKIGTLKDKITNDRIQIPVMNECVVSHTNPNMKIKFESSMTEAQHRAFNQFLNKALVASKTPRSASIPSPKPRIPMSYRHTHETDTFYELSQAGALQLPRSIASGLSLNPHSVNKSKVRITTDQKTGKELAKIIKTRVADIDIYSPKTAFDWRVSVNVEMNFEGDMKGLVETERRDGRKADRNKDRMSYQHLAYQIDLTQVTPAEATPKTQKEHELEIEVSSAEVRRQGLLAANGQVNQYEELIRGFVDNVRVLVRHCQQ